MMVFREGANVSWVRLKLIVVCRYRGNAKVAIVDHMQKLTFFEIINCVSIKVAGIPLLLYGPVPITCKLLCDVFEVTLTSKYH